MSPPADKWSDAVISLLLLALGGGVFWLSRDLPSPLFVPLTPAFFPRLVAGFLGGLALLLLVRALRGDRGLAAAGAATAGAQAPGRLGPALLVFGTLGGYIALIPRLGFYASTLLFLVALDWLLEERRLARLPRVVAAAVATTVVTYLVFTKYLQVLFPEGLLR